MGAWILGPGDEPLPRRRIRIQLLLTVTLLTGNAFGAASAVILIVAVVPGPPVFVRELVMVNFVLVPLVVAAAFTLGLVWVTRAALKRLRWAIDGLPATSRDLRRTLSMPLRLTLIQAVLWLIAAGGITVAYAVRDIRYWAPIAFTAVFSGVVTCAICYLLSEFALRPTAAQALASAPPTRMRRRGVMTRTVMAWLIGTGVPVVGLMLIGVAALTVGSMTIGDLAVPVLALGGVVLAVGLLLTLLVTSSTLAPVRTVRRAMAELERDELDAQVVVFDGSELGELQRGFNEMAQGLRERERIREVFGRHVGHAVAHAALQGDFDPEGQEVDVAVLFIDIVGSTSMAATQPPKEVVALLNRFFSVVVDEVDARDGLINKFEGDAALAVFGAPAAIPEACTAALAAARTITVRLGSELSGAAAGVGVAFGTAVAGNIGARERYEYTVIGDAVNEAARLSELAKTCPGYGAASGAAWQCADSAERARWQRTDEVVLRGRRGATSVYSPGGAPRTDR